MRESDVHQEAKLALARRVNHGGDILLHRVCYFCGGVCQPPFETDQDSFYEDCIPHPWSGTEAVVEYLLPNGRRADVTFLKERVPVGIVEVRRVNPVGSAKRQDLDLLGIPWCEVLASEVLGDASTLNLLQDHLTPPFLCGHCRKREG